MLSEKQILEIREHLDRSNNPLFLYDNDADGFCSYVLLRKYIGRGKGIAVRSHPDVDEGYAKRIQELNSDYVFVLDRPLLGSKFVEEVRKMQIPIVWIDHHDVEEESHEYENLFTYNPSKNKKKSSEPVSYWSYKIANRQEDLWIALMGCIADHYLPDFSEIFSERYSELWAKNVKGPFDAYYGSEIGRLARVIGFALKDSITHVVQFQNFMLTCSSPLEMGLSLESSKPFAKKYRDIRKKYDLLIEKAKKNADDNVVFFRYGGDLSMSSDISNELSHTFPGRVIVVAYTSGPITNMSLRGKNVKKMIAEILKDFDNSSGGGHEEAVGARIQTEDLERFKEEVYKRI